MLDVFNSFYSNCNYIKQQIMQYHGSEPCSPLTFTYTTRTQSEQTRSAHSSHTLSSLQRVNQLRPTSKIILPKKGNNKRQHKQQPSSATTKLYQTPNPKKYEPDSPTRTIHKIVHQKEEISNIKDNQKNGFKWGKFNFVCGASTPLLGQNGCLCENPCKWKQRWVRSSNKSADLLAFNKLMQQKVESEHLTQIEKDLLRTYPECPTFNQNPRYLNMLRTILIGYSIYDVQLGYVQGVNMLTAVLLYHIKDVGQTFWALVDLMEQRQLRMIYLEGFQYLKIHEARIMELVKQKKTKLYELIEQLQIIPECFLNGWVLSLMSNCVPIEYMPRVLDGFMSKGWNFIYGFIIVYLGYWQERLMLSGDQAQFLECLNPRSGRQVGQQWINLVQKGLKFKQ